jgi:8-oxo-dGTP pyrophosphatase MutT (NUDIX family)
MPTVSQAADRRTTVSDVSTVPAREAATVILVRDTAPFEVLMIARNPAGRVMGGVWAFPGGGVEAIDGAGEERFRAAAIRELDEETAIAGLEPADLVPYSRWVAPISLPVRFDTHFFLALAPLGARAVVDGVECVDAIWIAPGDALSGELSLLLPTRRQLERLAAQPTLEALFADGVERPVETVRPRLVRRGDPGEVVLPGEPGYETAVG